MAGYRTELQRIERDIAELSIADLFAVPMNPERLTRYVYLLYQRASISGDLSKLSVVATSPSPSARINKVRTLRNNTV